MLVLKIISIFNWFVFVCFNNATKNNMLGRNILDKVVLVVESEISNRLAMAGTLKCTNTNNLVSLRKTSYNNGQ